MQFLRLLSPGFMRNVRGFAPVAGCLACVYLYATGVLHLPLRASPRFVLGVGSVSYILGLPFATLLANYAGASHALPVARAWKVVLLVLIALAAVPVIPGLARLPFVSPPFQEEMAPGFWHLVRQTALRVFLTRAWG